jgi:hypothetical protein
VHALDEVLEIVIAQVDVDVHRHGGVLDVGRLNAPA